MPKAVDSKDRPSTLKRQQKASSKLQRAVHSQRELALDQVLDPDRERRQISRLLLFKDAFDAAQRTAASMNPVGILAPLPGTYFATFGGGLGTLAYSALVGFHALSNQQRLAARQKQLAARDRYIRGLPSRGSPLQLRVEQTTPKPAATLPVSRMVNFRQQPTLVASLTSVPDVGLSIFWVIFFTVLVICIALICAMLIGLSWSGKSETTFDDVQSDYESDASLSPRDFSYTA